MYKLLYTYPTGRGKRRRSSAIAKFMLSIREESYQRISAAASERGVSVQELLRAVVLPEWVKDNIGPSTLTQPLRQAAPQTARYSIPSKQPDPFIRVPLARSKI